MPMGPAPGNEHVLAHQIEAQRGMDGVAERIENRRNLVRDSVRERHHVALRQANVLGKAPRPMDADAYGVPAEMAAPGATVPTCAANHVTLADDALPDPVLGRSIAAIDDLAAEFMPDDHGNGHRARGPLIPFPDMDVRPADGRLPDLDQHLVCVRLGHRNPLHPQTFLGPGLHECLHVAAHAKTPMSWPTSMNASIARSSSSRPCAADIWVRIRSWPRGTTGKLNGAT